MKMLFWYPETEISPLGQLGRQKSRETRLLAEVEGLGGVTAIACGQDHCLALCKSGQVYSWGKGEEGQLGIGACQLKNLKPRKVVIPIPILIPIFQVSCGNVHSLALTAGGEVFSWGQNSHGQLGLGKEVSIQPTPHPLLSLHGVPVTQISAGGAHSLFLSLSGLVYCCGANAVGQLGLNRIDERGRFNVREVPALRSLGVSYISCGEAHTAVLAQEGGVFTFGEGTLGQLGHNSTANELGPRRVENIEGPASQIACGSHHTLVLTSSGVLLAFGSGVKGQLGQGSTENSLQPTPVQDTWRTAPLTAYNMKISCGYNSNFLHFVPPERFEAKDQICKIDEDKLQKWLSLRASSKDAEREITSIFSSNASLVASFIQSSQTPVVNSTAVNMTTVRETFSKLKEIPWIANVIPMGPLTGTLLFASKFMKSVDIFLILPECHLFHEDQNVLSLVLPLARAIEQLSDVSTQSLKKQWSSLETQSMKTHVHVWKNALSFMLKAGLLRIYDGNAKDLLQILKHLHKVCKQSIEKKIPVEDFYINEICPSPFLMMDADLWWKSKQMPDQEFPAIFCNFPFLLNLQSKIVVFNYESAITKNTLAFEAQSKFFGLLPSEWPLDLPPSPQFHLKVKRNALIEDTFRKLSLVDHEDFKKQLIVHFVDDLKESFVNQRDFFLHLFEELRSPDSGMFTYNDSETLMWFPSQVTS
ncbi:hypothetical protein AGOR_G00190030 [Albula goreensis]|uniref:HECT domain-containing protein n=1 Tax=Albula goreensis TaxID=1534307 RepID=A0A8T3CUZ1_9TELE|nr:hypothetical protein AGOR_G00190030 [Albula goreensis]